MHPYEVDENAGVPPDERGTAHPDPRSNPTVRTALFLLFLFNGSRFSFILRWLKDRN